MSLGNPSQRLLKCVWLLTSLLLLAVCAASPSQAQQRYAAEDLLSEASWTSEEVADGVGGPLSSSSSASSRA